jgi:hypothetical protein
VCAAQRRNDIGIEAAIGFEVLAQRIAPLDLVDEVEKRPRPERVKAPREMLQPHQIAAKTDFNPGAVGFLGGGDCRLGIVSQQPAQLPGGQKVCNRAGRPFKIKRRIYFVFSRFAK